MALCHPGRFTLSAYPEQFRNHRIFQIVITKTAAHRFLGRLDDGRIHHLVRWRNIILLQDVFYFRFDDPPYPDDPDMFLGQPNACSDKKAPVTVLDVAANNHLRLQMRYLDHSHVGYPYSARKCLYMPLSLTAFQQKTLTARQFLFPEGPGGNASGRSELQFPRYPSMMLRIAGCA